MECLVHKYQDRLYNAILRICADPEDAAELTQETFVKVIEALDSFKGNSSFYTWAFRIAVNLAINHCHRRARFGIRSLESEAGQGHMAGTQVLKDLLASDSLPDPASTAEDNELMALVRCAIMQLDEMHRTVLVLRDIEGMSYSQIADVLGIELGTVRSRLSRARDALRKALEAML